MEFFKTDFYKKLNKFGESDLFFNIFISGPKGSGKTKTIEHIHKALGKKLVRVNISIETDEDSLIGGLRLKDGQTIFEKGPVLRAMEEGATLLLDEIDQGHPQRLMCLQSILEGSPYHVKRIDTIVEPKNGFKVWATANTKGIGDDSGQYIGAQILNAAMRDRFSMFIDVKYPEPEVEISILNELKKHLEATNFSNSLKITDKQIKKLVTWGGKVRSSVQDESDETISTRKLIDIVKCFYLVQDIKTAIRDCISGYQSEFVEAYMKIYDLLDDDGNSIPDPTAPKQTYHKF